MAAIQRRAFPEQVTPRTVLPIAGGLVFLMAAIATGSAIWMGLFVAAIVGLAVLSRVGILWNLYLFAALIWLLPRIYVPGLNAILPLHVLFAGGLGLLCVGQSLLAVRATGEALLPPLWPLVGVYAIGGFASFFGGFHDLDTANGLKYLVEACVLAPLIYLLVWRYFRSVREAERLILILAVSILVLGTTAFALQGSAFWSPVPFEKEGLRLSGQYQLGWLYVIVTPVMMGTGLSMLIPALAAVSFNSTVRLHRVISIVLLAPLSLLALLAAGRSGWLGSFAALAVVLFFSVRAGNVSLPRLATLTTVGLFLAALTVTSLGLVNDEIARRLTSLGSVLEDDTVVFRYWIWGLGIDLVREHPVGVGFQAIRVLYGYPAHNQFILWALGTGVTGFGAVVSFLVAWLVRSSMAAWSAPEGTRAVQLAALGAVVAAMISINGDNISTSTGWTQSMLWIFLALGAAMFSCGDARQARQASEAVR